MKKFLLFAAMGAVSVLVVAAWTPGTPECEGVNASRPDCQITSTVPPDTTTTPPTTTTTPETPPTTTTSPPLTGSFPKPEPGSTPKSIKAGKRAQAVANGPSANANSVAQLGG